MVEFRRVAWLCLLAVPAWTFHESCAQETLAVRIAHEPCLDGSGGAEKTHVGSDWMACPVWCQDDYCPKCPPCIRLPKYCGTCDCYQPKCPPLVCPPFYCGTGDCYVPKCPPCVSIPRCFPKLRLHPLLGKHGVIARPIRR